MKGRRNPAVPLLLALPLLLAAIALLQIRIDARTRILAQEKEELLLRSGPLLKKISLGYAPLLADIYWTRAIQYYGSKVSNRDPNFELLSPLLELTTALDPKLMVAYHFGSVFLSEPSPIGAGRPDLAVQLIQRGISANPNDWNLYFDLGFLYFWHLREFDNAAAAYKKASEVPGSPAWLKVLAARITDGKSALEASRMIWTQIYETARHPKVRERALQQLVVLRVQEDVGWLNYDAMIYRSRFGRSPASSEDLVNAGIIRAIPLDPSGVPYMFGPDGNASLNPNSGVVLPSQPGLNSH